MNLFDVTVEYSKFWSLEHIVNHLILQKMQEENAENKDKAVSTATSHLIFTEECWKQARTVYNLLRRIKCKIPRQLKSLMSGMKMVSCYCM